MAEPVDMTLEVLKQIRDEVKGLNGRVDGLAAETRVTNERLEAVGDDLAARIDETTRRIVDSEVRTATAITGLAGTVQELTAYLRTLVDLRPRLEQCERDIAGLKAKADDD